MKATATKKVTVLGSPKPFETITVYPDKTYTPAEIQNDGTIHFYVEFPAGKDICHIKLHVEFEDAPKHRMLRGTGGTVVIGG